MLSSCSQASRELREHEWYLGNALDDEWNEKKDQPGFEEECASDHRDQRPGVRRVSEEVVRACRDQLPAVEHDHRSFASYLVLLLNADLECEEVSKLMLTPESKAQS